MSELLTIKEAAAKGIERLRQPQWANPLDHIKIDLVAGGIGPWVHLWCPYNTECNKRDPVDMLIFQVDIDKSEWLPYTGPLEDSDEYKAEVAGIAADTARLGLNGETTK
jgi:hypothetical protein